MEIPRPGLLDLLQCGHEGAQGAIVPAILVVGALFKMANQNFFFLPVAHTYHLTKDRTTEIIPFSTEGKVSRDPAPRGPALSAAVVSERCSIKRQKTLCRANVMSSCCWECRVKSFICLSDFPLFKVIWIVFVNYSQLKGKKKTFSGTRLALLSPSRS